LHRHDLRVCELSGQYNIVNIDANAVRKFNDAYVTDEQSALKLSGLLKNCTQEVQKQFAKDMKKLIFKAGETICSQGEVGDTMYIIAEGVVNVIVEVSTDDKHGKKKSSAEVVTFLSDGDYFGEMALLCGDERNATIVAKTNVVLYEISRATVRTFVAKLPDFAKKLSTAIVERNKSTQSARSEAIKSLNARDGSISELMSAFKVFLGGE
jgi:CRP-like cAMP-binding protein